MERFWAFFELSVNLFQSILVVQVLSLCMGHRYEKTKHHVLTAVFILTQFIALSWINQIFHFEGLAILIIVLILFVYACIALEGKVVQKLGWSVFVIIATLCITFLVLCVEGLIVGKTYIELVKESSAERLVGVLMIQLILFYLSSFAVRRVGSGFTNLMTRNEWMVLMAIPAISVFTLSFVAYVFINEHNSFSILQQKLAIITGIGITITNLLVYMLFYRLQKSHESQLHYEKLKQIYQSGEKNVEEAKELYDAMRGVRHDLKNQLGIILGMLREKKYAELEEYVGKYNVEVIGRLSSQMFCQNEAVNYLINEKYRICEQKDIVMRVVSAEKLPEISDVEMVVLLGNALDNALEGCTGKSKKEINVDMRWSENFFVFQIKNTIGESVLQKNPRLLTSKKDKADHGLGLTSMRKVTEKYNGYMNFAEEEGFFVCTIALDVGE